MASFSVRFLGCKVSHTDAQEIRDRLLRDGHREDETADVAIVNTCCVTNEAVRKSRQAAARAARTHRRVYVTGCGANLAGDAFAGVAPNVTVIRRPSEATPDVVARDVGAIGCVQADSRLDRVRAFLKIQDGCSFSCSFCYRDREAGYGLARLVREVGALPGLARLRLSSIEINHVGEELVRALRETPTVSRHLHVPLQSGDDEVLRAMGRRYSSGTYLRRLAGLDEFNLTTDVIVGFPGEDERAFANTLSVVGTAGITKAHVFPYSPRPGTVTAAEDTVPPTVKKERSARLREASHVACLERWRGKIGRVDLVLVDRPGRGYGDDYSPWLVDGPVGELVSVRGAGVTDEGILAA